MPKNNLKILVIMNDRIGDLVLCTGVFREIKMAIPKVEITTLVSKVNFPIVEKNDNIKKRFILDSFWKKRKLKNFFEYLKILRKIRKEKFDIGIDLRGSNMNIFFFLVMGDVIEKYSLNKNRNNFLNGYVPRNLEVHETELAKRIVEKAVKIKIKNSWPDIPTDEQDEKEVDNFLKNNQLKEFIVICPGANSELKMWETKKFDELIKWINNKFPEYKIILCGGEEDRGIIEKLAKENSNCMVNMGFNLRNLSLLSKKAKLFICHDGGPMHIAWCAKAKMIVLWGPTSMPNVKPLGKNVVIIHHKTDCYPCYLNKECIKPKGNRCMDLISLEEVEKAVDKILGEKKER
ncbi:MAG: glycosyltransferase family 9 protein [Nanoarchaeota archaeon]|nr:glycosyltransferase family 9 protein [Nanoarchaeota archaeon]